MAVWHSISGLGSDPGSGHGGRGGGRFWTRLGTWRAEVFRDADAQVGWRWEATHDGDRRSLAGLAETREAAQAMAEHSILLQNQ